MLAETIARAGALSDAPDKDDYQAFCQALSASERGRLAEYARRNRNADTEQAGNTADDRAGQTAAARAP